MDIYGGNSHAIGNYIHYNPRFYFRCGLEYPSQINQGNWGRLLTVKYLNGMHDKMRTISNMGTSGKAKELERQLNFFYNKKISSFGEESNEKLESEFRDALYNSLTTYLEQYLYGNLDLDFDKLSVGFSEGLDKDSFAQIGKNMYNKKYKNATYNLGMLRKKIYNFKKVLEKESEEISKELKSKGSISDDRRLQLNMIEEELKNLEQETQILSSNVGDDSIIYLKRNNKITKQGNLVQHFNQIKGQFIMTKAQMMGEIGEFMVPGILFMLKNKANENIEEIMKEFALKMAKGQTYTMGNDSFRISGADATNKGLFQANFNFNLKELLEEYKLNSKNYLGYTNTDAFGNLISTKATMDKVDAEIHQMDEDFNLSIKNYSLVSSNANISIFHGNLFRLIQHETDFINHYLNITSVRDEFKNYVPSRLIMLAKRNLKELLMIKGLTGGIQIGKNMFTKEANYFVVNDATKGHFYVYDMNTLINKILKEGDKFYEIKYDESIENLKQKPLGDPNDPNQRIQSIAKQRSMNLSAQLVDKHVDMYIKQGAIKTF